MFKRVSFALLISAAFAIGCELIAAVDRNLISTASCGPTNDAGNIDYCTSATPCCNANNDCVAVYNGCGTATGMGPATNADLGSGSTSSSALFCAAYDPMHPVLKSDGTCGACATNADCASLQKTPACDTSSGACVACVSDGDCSSGTQCLKVSGASSFNYCGYPVTASVTGLSGSALSLTIASATNTAGAASSFTFSIPANTTTYEFPLDGVTVSVLPSGVVLPKGQSLGSPAGNLLLASGQFTATAATQPTGETCTISPTSFTVSAATALTLACCPTSQMLCGTECVTVATDAANCGSCGHACDAGLTCVSSACISTPTLSYSQDSYSLTLNQPATAITPTLSAGASATVTGCVASPTLPTGLSLNATTCAISGTPTIAAVSASYMITVTNSFSQTANATVVIAVTATAATCSDMMQNQGETDVDCGGSHCPPCTDTKMCLVNSDCTSQVCSTTCQAPTCVDLTQNQDETDIDCGGATCAKCAPPFACLMNSDCTTANCVSNVCTISANGGSCVNAFDCASSFCNNGQCAACGSSNDCGIGRTCTAGVCTSGGGGCPGVAPSGNFCVSDMDCQSCMCVSAMCQ